MKLAKYAVLLALLASPTAHAGGDSPPMPEMRPKLDDFELGTMALRFPTGLQILIQEDHSHPIVTIYKYVGHGFNDDPVGAEETAHFVEHTWFRSVHGNMPPIMFLIQDLGTMFNATTAADRTDYRTTANVKYLPIMLKLESLRMTDFYRGVTEEQVEVEREVIRNEWRQRNEQSQALLFDYMNEALYPEGHPYARRSTHESLENIKLDVLQTYVDTYYKPEDTTITIVGDFDTEAVISMILENFDLSLLHPKLTKAFTEDPANADFMKQILDYRLAPGVPGATTEEERAAQAADPTLWRLFLRNPENPTDPNDVTWFVHTGGSLPKRIPDARPEPPEVGIGGKEPQFRKGPVKKTTVLVGWSLPAGYHDDHFNLQMLGNLASGYVANGLDLNFGDDVVAEEAGCFSQPGLHATTMLCGVDVNNKKLDPVNVAEKIIDQMSAITDPEGAQMFNMQFSRGKQEFLRQTLESVDLVAAVFGSRAESIGEFAHWTGDPAYYKRAFNGISRIEGATMAKLADTWLKRDRAAILIVEPLEASEIDVSSSKSSYAGTTEGDAVIEASDDLSLADQAAIAGSYAKPRLDKLVDTKLDNGLRVVILPQGEAPKVHARLVFGGGTASEPRGIHDFAARYTRSVAHDPLQIAATPWYGFVGSFLGLSQSEAWPISGDATNRVWDIGMTAPSGNLDGALWILRQELETASPYLSGKGSWIARQFDRLESDWFESGWHQGVLQGEHLYPGEARYRATSWEDVETWSGWGADDVKKYLDDHIHPENATLVIVGKVTPEGALAEAKEQFGGWTANAGSAKAGRPQLATPARPTATARVVIFDDEKRTQTESNFACRLDTRGDADREAVDVLGTMLGNQTFATLRVKEGLAYSPYAAAFTREDDSAMLIFSSTAINSGVGRTVEFFKHAVDRVDKGDVNADEVKLYQLRINRSEGVGNQSVEQAAGLVVGAVRGERTWEELAATGDRIAAVTPEDLTRLTKGCLDHALITLEGPKDIITAQLDERGIAYEIYDYEKAGEDLLWKYDKKAAKKRAKDKAKQEAKEAEEEGSGDSSTDAGE